MDSGLAWIHSRKSSTLTTSIPVAERRGRSGGGTKPEPDGGAMQELSLRGCRNVLCLGAHSDDIEIGCGGTILKLARASTGLNVMWVVFSAASARASEAERSAATFLSGARRRKVVLKRFRASFFPYQGERVKKYFEQLKHSFQPDLVFTHYRHDLHQDHRTVSDLTWNTFRNH